MEKKSIVRCVCGNSSLASLIYLFNQVISETKFLCFQKQNNHLTRIGKLESRNDIVLGMTPLFFVSTLHPLCCGYTKIVMMNVNSSLIQPTARSSHCE